MESLPSFSPGSRSSSPVEITTTRGRGRDATREVPTEASRPIWRGPIRSPSLTNRSPTLTSSPACRMCWPSSGACSITTVEVPPSVHSTGTTASQPCGTGAPVMIRTAVPVDIAMIVAAPAAISPTTGRCTGRCSLAPATSWWTTA